MPLSDDERGLAEYIARWVGSPLASEEWKFANDIEILLCALLTDRALAMRALEEMIERGHVAKIWMDRDEWCCEAGPERAHGSTPLKAIFRAHRAVFGGDGDG